MTLIKVPYSRFDMLQEFCDKSMLTFEGIDLESEEGLNGLNELEKILFAGGYKGEEIIGYYFNGYFMNEAYGYSGDNKYPDNLTFLVIPDFYNPAVKMTIGARWFDDIIANNSIRQNAVDCGLEPDYG